MAVGRRPPNPGRLNDLRTSSTSAPTNLSPFSAEPRHDDARGVLKENIDARPALGARPALARPEERRILLVITTARRSTIRPPRPMAAVLEGIYGRDGWIEGRSSIELAAIGIGHDVTRYYSRAVTIMDAEQLGGALIEQLAALFDKN